jgi:hypothetical protein
MRFVPISEFRRASLRGDRHWFSSATLRWWSTRLPAMGYTTDDQTVGFFVSSEQDRSIPYAAWDGERRYSVRRMDFDTGRVSTVGEFGGYMDRRTATRAAMDAAREAEAARA